jgi:hypothetical protein
MTVALALARVAVLAGVDGADRRPGTPAGPTAFGWMPGGNLAAVRGVRTLTSRPASKGGEFDMRKLSMKTQQVLRNDRLRGVAWFPVHFKFGAVSPSGTGFSVPASKGAA